ncbi:MAG: hypothetical protein KAS32_17825, partial [Candidatus Peribacteraceae bacterium]|nr:hypothetical protein [Candidatus Peribacteraceae bacterium]
EADPEVTLVHELIHIADAARLDRFEGQLNEQEDAIMIEQVTDKLALTLVALRRADAFHLQLEVF